MVKCFANGGFDSELSHVFCIAAHVSFQTITTKLLYDMLKKAEINKTQVEIEVQKDAFDRVCFFKQAIFWNDEFFVFVCHGAWQIHECLAEISHSYFFLSYLIESYLSKIPKSFIKFLYAVSSCSA